MKELLTYIVQSLVDNPDQVSVTERKTDGETVYEVRVADGDMGKVIGRQGRIVKQIRPRKGRGHADVYRQNVGYQPRGKRIYRDRIYRVASEKLALLLQPEQEQRDVQDQQED